jgi:hypothetical protein
MHSEAFGTNSEMGMGGTSRVKLGSSFSCKSVKTYTYGMLFKNILKI